MAENEYIRFQLYEEKEKTKVWCCYNKKACVIIGYVKWHPQWRQYVYQPNPSIYSSGCLDYISEFVKEKNREHKSK